jgi:hypothetical protein
LTLPDLDGEIRDSRHHMQSLVLSTRKDHRSVPVRLGVVREFLMIEN